MASDLLDGLLRILTTRGGSDLHLKVSAVPRIRVKGNLAEVVGVPALTELIMNEIAKGAMSDDLWHTLDQDKQCDFAYQCGDGSRFRANAFFQRGSISMVFRRVASAPATLSDLALPEVVSTLSNERRGLILVTGPTGSGKTSTLAAMIRQINENRACHIITIEDPIEIMHSDKRALVNQREIGFDATTFAKAMKSAMREDPDVILIGEMRDEETVHAAISAAETGHLVLSTLHTTNAKETISRIVDFFPSHQHAQVRTSLAGSLKGVICQRLVKVRDANLRPVLEVMVANGRISQAILDPVRGGDIPQIIKEGEFYGMRTFEKSLYELVEGGVLDANEALLSATSPQDLTVMLQRSGII
ncbi:MAG: PilT/PilU family type 4a pilus ATPase [Actinomycetota bacterium]|nr:PilT/PilU family type 4a pilus ATPase [Actinomycetota bacterium]